MSGNSEDSKNAGAVPANPGGTRSRIPLTWGQFKKEVEAAGVKDTDEIFYMDFSYPYEGDLHITREDTVITIS